MEQSLGTAIVVLIVVEIQPKHEPLVHLIKKHFNDTLYEGM